MLYRPIFIEAVEGERYSDVQICRKVMAHLFKKGVSPLPFATSAAELTHVLAALEQRETKPAIFIVNTFWIEHFVMELDKLMGETPTLFFRRELYSYTPWLKALFNELPDQLNTSVYLATMTPRLASAWTYGPRNSNEVAERAADGIIEFLKNKQFSHIEKARVAAPILRQPAVGANASATAKSSAMHAAVPASKSGHWTGT